MAIIIRLPSPLRKLTAGQEEVHGRGETVAEVLQNLEKDFPGLKERLFDEHGSLRKFINIYLNDQDIRFLNNLETQVPEGSTISLIPAIAGGTSQRKTKKKIYLTFPQRLIQKPIIYQVGHKFRVITNIRQASVSEEIGLVALELEGEEKEIEKATKYMKKQRLLYIPKVFLDEIIAHASREYPLECCGILAGKNNKILEVYPMENTEKSPSSYFMDPAAQYQVFQVIEQKNLELVAIYHSHPHSDAYPSPKDIDLSYYPDTFMVIISLRRLQNPTIAAFRIGEGRMEKIAIKIL